MDKILIWGTGKISDELSVNELAGEIIGYIETNKKKEMYKGKPVYSIGEIPLDYEYIIVANTYSNEIYQECVNRKLDLSKIIYLYPLSRVEGISDLNKIKVILGEENFTSYCVRFGLVNESFFAKDLVKYREMNTRKNMEANDDNLWPVIFDKYHEAGKMGNYFWQDLWAAKLVFDSGVKRHFDIGSRIDGFIAHLLAMNIDVTLIDIRKFPSEVEGLHTIVDDATSLQQVDNESIDSMSALCSLEHFGLGRYGDPIDPEACFKCFKEIQKKIKVGGRLYISLPIGAERVEFNAHRIFYPETIIECFSDMNLIEFSCTSEGKIEKNVDIHEYDKDMHNGEHRYGLFFFEKRG